MFSFTEIGSMKMSYRLGKTYIRIDDEKGKDNIKYKSIQKFIKNMIFVLIHNITYNFVFGK